MGEAGKVHSFHETCESSESKAIYLVFQCGGACGWQGNDVVSRCYSACDEAHVDEARVPERAYE
jgi:hypothetical protein